MINTGEVLKAMAASGPLTASRLVMEAAAEDHPLHGHFEWREDVAAHMFRLHQARRLIVEVVERPEGARRPIPVFVHVPLPTGEGEYVLTEFVVRQPDWWELARSQVLRYLQSAEENVAEMEEAQRIYGKGRSRSLREAHSLIERAQMNVAKT